MPRSDDNRDDDNGSTYDLARVLRRLRLRRRTRFFLLFNELIGLSVKYARFD
jgi:uncharacterized protein YjiS (DUF1127 family)